MFLFRDKKSPTQGWNWVFGQAWESPTQGWNWVFGQAWESPTQGWNWVFGQGCESPTQGWNWVFGQGWESPTQGQNWVFVVVVGMRGLGTKIRNCQFFQEAWTDTPPVQLVKPRDFHCEGQDISLAPELRTLVTAVCGESTVHAGPWMFPVSIRRPIPRI